MTGKYINKIISILYRYNQCFFAKKLKENSLPIDVAHIPPLMQIYRYPGITQDGISMNVGMDKGTVARTVKQLEDAGLIMRKTDEYDRRVNHIFPTPRGLEIKGQVFRIIEELHGVLYYGFDAGEIDQAFSYIERMKDNMASFIKGERDG